MAGTKKKSYKRKFGRSAPYTAYKSGLARWNAGRREREMEAFGESFVNALNGKIGARKKMYDAGEVNRAWGQGKYRIGAGLKHFGRGLAAHEKKHHTLGRAAMGALKRMSGAGMYTGSGMYTGNGSYAGSADGVQSNSLVNNSRLEGVPEFSSSGDETGAITITHREYVTELYGPENAFNVQGFALNPGVEKTFPFLSQIAGNYEEYELSQCLFTYRSTTSDNGNSSTGQVGTVIMATQYNPSKPLFDSKQMMMGYDSAMSGKTTADHVHGVECDNAKLSGTDEKYVRTGPVTDDLKNYDHGLFQIAISNSPSQFANQSLGELWVSYTVTLRKPKLFAGRGFTISNDYFCLGDATPTIANPLAVGTTGYLKALSNSIGTTLFGYTAGGTDMPQSYDNSLGAEPTYPALVGAADYTVLTGEIGILFPAGYGGYVEVTLNYLAAGTTHDCDLASFVCKTFGNCVPVEDILVVGATGSCNYDYFTPTIGALGSQSVVIKAHFFVREATNGCNNYVVIGNPISGVSTNFNTTLTVAEYNTSGSYNFANKGTSMAPIMVDLNGTVVSPVDGAI